ncbi:MAG: glycerophosphoryl diester phosphodiesterase [Flavobacterium sp.]|jgi:glycerophosphoryl diester phosphodiesterase
MKFQWAFYSLIIFSSILLGLSFWTRSPPDHVFFSQFSASQYPLVIAHADDTGNGLWPGSTHIFLDGVAELGVDIVELDVHMTKDGHIVVMHDNTVDRTTNGSGLISSMTFAEIKTLKVAEKWSNDGGITYPYKSRALTIPSLKEVFAKFPDYPMNIEIKQEFPSMAIAFCDVLREFNMTEKVLVPSFSAKAMGEFRHACPEVATAASGDDTQKFVLSNFIFLSKLLSPEYEAFQVPHTAYGFELVTSHFTDSAHKRNLQVHVWTINDPVEMNQLIDLGVDGIMTDRPDILLETLGRISK